MIGVKMYHTIITLRKAGKSQREIAADLGLSKTTVNKYSRMIVSCGEAHSCRRAGRSAFAVAEPYIIERLSVKPKLRASKLYQEVIRIYPQITSKQRAFRTFISGIRRQIPKPPRRCFSIIETDPGKQVQVDLGEMQIDRYPRGVLKVYFASFVLSCSRYTFVHWQLRPYKTADFIDAHRQAFIYFEGVPEECVYDQTKLAVIEEKYREVILNQEFHQFAYKVGFHPYVCEGYDPQSKGKIERTIQEVKCGFLYGSVFSDLQDIQAKGYQWLAQYNGRVHATTHLIPAQAWLSEKAQLKPIPDSLAKPVMRKADKTGLISYSGNKYSVPLEYQEREVIVSEHEGGLFIIDPVSYQTVATHAIPAIKGLIIKSANHYRDYSLECQELLAQTLDLLSVYPQGKELVLKVVSDNPKIPRAQLQAIRNLFKNYEKIVWLAALPLINQHEQLRATLIEDILNATEKAIRLKNIAAVNSCTKIAGSAIQRSLNDYMRIIDHDRAH